MKPLIVICASLAFACTGVCSGGPDFTREVLPILAAKCIECHGPDAEARKGNLRFDDGETPYGQLPSGVTPIVPGDCASSALIARITAEDPEKRMPPRDYPKPLTAAEIEILRRWVDSGARWEQHWAFAPLSDPAVPETGFADGIRNPIDNFIRAALEEQRLAPSPEADRRTLIRRLHYDLTGLPPTPDQVAAFLDDHAPDAYERLVERLLASPRYGERWGRHWLDVARYADTHGYDKDKRRPHAWPYRDYVIRAFNEDKPYGRFVEEQIAGDVLYPDDPQATVATGFLAAGPWDYVGHVELREGTKDKKITRLLDRDDMVSSVMSAFTSLTVHCARCHDHKFDPITQKDYYSLQAVFAGIDRADRPYDATPETYARRRELLRTLRALEMEQRALGELPEAIGSPEIEALDRRAAELKSELEALPEPLYVYAAAADFTGEGNFQPARAPREIAVLHRGDVEQPGEPAIPGTVSCLPWMPNRFEGVAEEGARRAALARWISSTENALTWRSIVNRIWHYHYGRGIVDTPNDFGRMGSPPTHPELLDWLACRFLESGQSMKDLHRLIVMSATYRQVSTVIPEFARIDGSNRYLWRMNRTQIDAESLRDTMLFVSGLLDMRMGGPGFDLFAFEDDHSPRYLYARHDPLDPASLRRSVYRFVVRSVPDPFMTTLDCADPSQSVPVRTQTVTALQALSQLNNRAVVAWGEAFARRVERMEPDPANRVEAAMRLALGRAPEPEERGVLNAYAERHGLPAVCRLIFNLNEFLFID